MSASPTGCICWALLTPYLSAISLKIYIISRSDSFLLCPVSVCCVISKSILYILFNCLISLIKQNSIFPHLFSAVNKSNNGHVCLTYVSQLWKYYYIFLLIIIKCWKVHTTHCTVTVLTKSTPPPPSPPPDQMVHIFSFGGPIKPGSGSESFISKKPGSRSGFNECGNA